MTLLEAIKGSFENIKKHNIDISNLKTDGISITILKSIDTKVDDRVIIDLKLQKKLKNE